MTDKRESFAYRFYYRKAKISLAISEWMFKVGLRRNKEN